MFWGGVMFSSGVMFWGGVVTWGGAVFSGGNGPAEPHEGVQTARLRRAMRSEPGLFTPRLRLKP
jgi:hypothetical protein